MVRLGPGNTLLVSVLSRCILLLVREGLLTALLATKGISVWLAHRLDLTTGDTHHTTGIELGWTTVATWADVTTELTGPDVAFVESDVSFVVPLGLRSIELAVRLLLLLERTGRIEAGISEGGSITLEGTLICYHHGLSHLASTAGRSVARASSDDSTW